MKIKKKKKKKKKKFQTNFCKKIFLILKKSFLKIYMTKMDTTEINKNLCEPLHLFAKTEDKKQVKRLMNLKGLLKSYEDCAIYQVNTFLIVDNFNVFRDFKIPIGDETVPFYRKTLPYTLHSMALEHRKEFSEVRIYYIYCYKA